MQRRQSFHSRTRTLYQTLGYQVADVEHRHRNVTRDLWGFADLLAIREPDERLLVQVCTRDDRREHYRKMLLGTKDAGTPERIERALRCGFEVVLAVWQQGSWPIFEQLTLPDIQHPKDFLKKLKPVSTEHRLPGAPKEKR